MATCHWYRRLFFFFIWFPCPPPPASPPFVCLCPLSCAWPCKWCVLSLVQVFTADGGPWPWPTVLCVWQFIVWCHKCPNKCDIYLQRSIGILICLPGPGTDCLSTLTSSLFLPRLMCEHLEWWQFRFNLEMFLPRHRVSLTLMVRRQKWGWRCPVIPLIRTFQECYY